MSIYKNLKRHLVAAEIPHVFGEFSDNSGKHIEISKINKYRNSEIVVGILFDGTGHLLKDISVYERPDFDADREIKLL